tara:strand:+ start:552 stop:3335 length:2784 start_codon:yes stop_codon:yes gene_type:complete
MDYNLNIVASVKGQAQLDSTLRTIGQIRNLAKDLKPLDFGTKKPGALADEIRKAKKELDDLGRNVTNAMQAGRKTTGLFSSTLAGVTGQARAFGTALDNLNFNKNAVEAQNYANALAQAEAKAEGLTAVQNKLITQARQQAGVAIGPATQLGSPEAVAQQVRFESAQITKANRLRTEQVQLVERINELASQKVQVDRLSGQVAKINLALDERRVDAAEEMTEELRDQIRQNEAIIRQNKKKNKGAEEEEKSAKRIRRTRKQMLGDAAQGAILGGGFPLLFGGPSFSAAGGLIGGGVGGAAFGQKASFAGGIAGSVLLTPLDAAVDAAVELGKALEEPTKNAQQLIDLLPLSGTKTKGLIRELQDLGLNTTASAVAVETLSEEIGEFGVKDIAKFKEKNDEFANEVKKLRLALAALASNKLIGFITFLTQAVNLFNRGGGVGQGGGMLGRAAGFAIAQGEMADEGVLGGKPSSAKPNGQPGLPTQNQIDLAKRAEQIRRAEIALAGFQVAIEQDRLNLIRGQLGVKTSQVAVAKADIKLAKAQLEFSSAQTDADRQRLGLKKALAEAELLEAQAAQRNAETLARQAQAAFELERATKNQAISMADMTAEIAAQQAVRATSPFENQDFLMDPFFGGSRKLESEQNQKFAETLGLMNAELDNVYKNIESGTDLDREAKLALADKAVELENNIARYKEYQPAIDQAALAQARFNEAMALAVPATDSLFNNLTAVVEGTKTAREAFADFLRDIASLLMDAAKQMIATYIAIGVARLFAGMGGGESQGAHRLEGVQASPAVKAGYPGNLNYAEGGYVSGPTRALVGEGGESEYIIPESKMRESMARYSRGARGSSVVPDAGASGTSGEGGGAAVAAPIDVRYTVERINNVDYVTAEQFQAGMRQAANQGAKQGEQQTLKRLQMSGSTRKRLGM